MAMGSLGIVAMHLLFFAIGFLLWTVVMWLQFKYKDANYPATTKWRLILFISGFLFGAFVGLLGIWDDLVNTADYSKKATLIMVVTIGGAFVGVLFGFGFPRRMQGTFPKHVVDSKAKTTKRTE